MLNSNITYTSTLIHDPNSGHFPNNKTMLKVKVRKFFYIFVMLFFCNILNFQL